MNLFICPNCGASHSRGPVNGVDGYRCLRCGTTTNVPKADNAANDAARLDWLEEHLCYAMVVMHKGAAMTSLPSNGTGWKSGRLRDAIDAVLKQDHA